MTWQYIEENSTCIMLANCILFFKLFQENFAENISVVKTLMVKFLEDPMRHKGNVYFTDTEVSRKRSQNGIASLLIKESYLYLLEGLHLLWILDFLQVKTCKLWNEKNNEAFYATQNSFRSLNMFHFKKQLTHCVWLYVYGYKIHHCKTMLVFKR